MNWEDKLIGRKITVVTDHQSLEFFKTQGSLSHCQSQWWEYLPRFDYDIVYVQGKKNTVANIFSRYYQHHRSDTLITAFEYVSADRHLDPEADDLPLARYLKIHELVNEVIPPPDECVAFSRMLNIAATT
jgi:hypothetical protein